MPMDGWMGGKKSKGGLLLWYWLVYSIVLLCYDPWL
jgi:hypothetical protein